uniref:Probable imidazolonepropionase n=1 Tax=Anas zonorhyncha TaxID=75864 RepID=A0A8B9VG47_9AVES
MGRAAQRPCQQHPDKTHWGKPTESLPCLPRGRPGAPLGAGGAISRTAPGDFEPSGGRPPAAIWRCHGGGAAAAAGERPAAGAGVRPGREVPAAGRHGQPGRAAKRQPGGGTLAGASYMEIHQAGGGIHFTVEHTRKATEEELFNTFKHRLERMRRAGSTLVECKSGYGLNLETELKMLRVIERAKQSMDIGISSTYCGAHSVPKGKTATEAADDIINNHLPKLKELKLSGEMHVNNIDVFCEKGVFDLDSTRRILQAGKDIGLQINFHGDELHPMKSAELGAELGAQAISHLEEVSDEGIAAIARAKCAAVLLPTTAYMLRLKQPQARKMLNEGVIVALGSDFNPNAYCFSMPMVMHLACVNMKMSMNEALAAATINAAYALGKSDTHGSIEIGKQGDLVIINSSRTRQMGAVTDSGQ